MSILLGHNSFDAIMSIINLLYWKRIKNKDAESNIRDVIHITTTFLTKCIDSENRALSDIKLLSNKRIEF